MSINRRPQYYLNKEGEFVIENYHRARPFSSFFPGIAGVWGVPIWVFYVNRGQGIASFGIKDKDHPIMEFQPANKAYQLTSLLGFRTLIKVRSKKKNIFYDAFHNGASAAGFEITNKMLINSYELKLKEVNHSLGIETAIEYFTIPNDNYGALSRKLSIKNISGHPLDFEYLDGLPQIIPYGLNNMFLKELSRTIEAWMDVENLENKIPYLRLKVDPSDRPEVTHISEGNFYLAFDAQGLIKPIVDPDAIFGRVSDFTYPEAFLDKPSFGEPDIQLTNSRTPCCMSYQKAKLKADGSLEMFSLIGNMDSLEKLKANSGRIASQEYLLKKQAENKKLVGELEASVFTHSSSRNFDLYCRQNFLDNVLRGGYPLSLPGVSSSPKDKDSLLVQVYSRKHGDLERDYNKFLLEPTYFSQGNGNFRDANQNRRADVWFNPALKSIGLMTFFNLLQTDGYNPLVLKPDNFIFQGDFGLLDKFFNKRASAKVRKRLEKPFTPGELIFFIERNIFKGFAPFKGREDFLILILAHSVRLFCAEHSEGFWIDHWTYCLDLLESYLGLYPEDLRSILLEKKDFTFFDNSEVVRPRKEKYALKGGRVFQYHSVVNNHTKNLCLRKREDFPHLSRTQAGEGDIYKTTLIVKMLVVIANKFASLDPFGAGVEMEANKPNWYDALNGLPGLLGSSTCETFELKRWIVFLQDALKKIGPETKDTLSLPVELHNLLVGLKNISYEGSRILQPFGLQDEPSEKNREKKHPRAQLNEYGFWDKSHLLREEYLQKTLMGFNGQERELSTQELNSILSAFLKKIDGGLKKACDNKQKLPYAYFINEVTDYKILDASERGHIIKPLKFKPKPLPLFLEGPVHSLRVIESQRRAKQLFRALRKSPLYDKKLKMYKVNAPLSRMPEEIGRCRAFTPGWLENESIWLHMEYKYILELLKNGLYKEFFEDFRNALIPFQDPERYGRSILENSSFLVSSAFPDQRLHGSGFVARLSGSTSEFISIWLIMCAGKNPFYLNKAQKLCLAFRPILPGWIFSRKEEDGFPKNTFAFKFLNKTLVVYHNPRRKDTFGPRTARIREISITFQDASMSTLSASFLSSPISKDIRNGKIPRIDIELE